METLTCGDSFSSALLLALFAYSCFTLFFSPLLLALFIFLSFHPSLCGFHSSRFSVLIFHSSPLVLLLALFTLHALFSSRFSLFTLLSFSLFIFHSSPCAFLFSVVSPPLLGLFLASPRTSWVSRSLNVVCNSYHILTHSFLPHFFLG